MKISIAAKLFFGFLVVIFLNVFFVVVVSKLTHLNSIATILNRQNEIRNTMLQVSALHSNQDNLYLIFDKLNRRESVDNFLEIGTQINLLLDSVSQALSIIQTNERILSQSDWSSSHNVAQLTALINEKILLSNSSYQHSFKSLSEIGKIEISQRFAMQKQLKQTIAEASDTLSRSIATAESLLEAQTQDYIKDIESRIDAVKQLTLIILGGMSLFALLFGMIFSHAITTSLRRLKESASQLAKGTFDFDPRGYPSDEIGELATAFFDMAYDLKNAQEELVRSKRLATIGEVVASVNHEINNPLMIISGNAQFLEMAMEDGPTDLKQRVQAIIEETERISRVTRKLREIKNPVVENYTSSGEQMINLEKSSQ
jgi:nitrogen fixation/metabolism regulation signal transduction histidine kinase